MTRTTHRIGHSPHLLAQNSDLQPMSLSTTAPPAAIDGS